MIYIVPFEFSNLANICRYFERNQTPYQLLNNNVDLVTEDHSIVIPGVGSFREGMSFLYTANLVDKIRGHAAQGGRVTGICLGMQLMFDGSDESQGVEGLGLLRGAVKKLSDKKGKVPRIGWDSVDFAKDSVTYSKFKGPSTQNYTSILSPDLYFVHSYYCVPEIKTVVSGVFWHGSDQYCASVESNMLYGLQFHPEKSGPSGYKILDAIFSL